MSTSSVSMRPAADADQPRIVFLHFLGGSGRSWDAVVARLSPFFACHAIDLPGFGGAADIVGDDVAAATDVVAGQIAALAPVPLVLVGHSMGAKIVAALARRAEDGDRNVAGLSHVVMIAGSPPRPEPMQDAKRAEMLGWFAGPPESRRREAEAYVDQNVALSLPPPTRASAVADVLRMRRSAWTAWLSRGSREDWTDRIGLLRTPTLIIAGAKDDALGPETQRHAMAPHFLNPKLATVPGAGHLIPMEYPGAIADLIAGHIGRRYAPLSHLAGLQDDAFAAVVASDRVSKGTRAVLMARLPATPDAASAAFPPPNQATLEALVRRILPQQTVDPAGLARGIARDLVAGKGDGWRFDLLPPDLAATLFGLQDLEASAIERHGRAFTALDAVQQDGLLAEVAAGRRLSRTSRGLSLTAEQLRLWFEEMRSAAVRAYVAHPATLARIDYNGFANGGDSPHKTGFVALGEGDREPWESGPRSAQGLA